MFQQTFDIIYLRWVLIYQKNITEILSKLHKILKPGGYLIVEDNNPAAFGCYAADKAPIIAKWQQFLQYAFGQAGQAAHLESCVIDAYNVLGMQQIKKTLNQAILTTQEEKAVFHLGLEESKQRILAAGMPAAQLNAFIKELQSLCQSQGMIDFVKNFQLTARK